MHSIFEHCIKQNIRLELFQVHRFYNHNLMGANIVHLLKRNLNYNSNLQLDQEDHNYNFRLDLSKYLDNQLEQY